jgi:hypothetical protein
VTGVQTCALPIYPAFDFMARGGKTPHEAIAACMFDTVGEA